MVSDRVVYADTSTKMKILGMGCQGIEMPNAVQLQEYSRSGGMDGILYKTATRTATSTFATSIGTMELGTGTTTGSTTTSTRTTSLCCLQLFSFLSRSKEWESFVL
jgi:hypothetical protein